MKRLIVLIVVLVVAALGAGISSAHGVVNLDVNSPAFLNGDGSLSVSGDVNCRPRQQAGARLQIRQNTGTSLVTDVGQCFPGGTFSATVFPRGSGFFHTGAAQATLIVRTGDGHEFTRQEVIQVVLD